LGTPIRLRKNSKICHSEPRSVFERGQESVFSLAFLRTADPSPANDTGSGSQTPFPQPSKHWNATPLLHKPRGCAVLNRDNLSPLSRFRPRDQFISREQRP